MAVASLIYFNKVLDILNSAPPLKRTAVGIAKQGLWAFGGTVAGGVVGGPPGAFVGACAGAYFGFATADEYQSLVKVLRELSDDEKYRLQCKIQQLVGTAAIEDFVSYIQTEAGRALLMNTLKEQTNNHPHAA